LLAVASTLVALGGLLGVTASPAAAAVGDITTYSDPAGGVNQPLAITAGTDGNLWFTSINNPTAIGRINPATGAITTYRDAEKVGGLRGITSGPDGAIWFLTHFGTFGEAGTFVGRIDPATGAITTFEDPTAEETPEGQSITTGPDGNLWYTAFVNRIVRFDPDDSTFTEYTAADVVGPNEIVAGPDGNLWFTSGDNDRIGRIDPDDGTITTYPDPNANVDSPFAITNGPDGNLWFTSAQNDRIGRIDPDDGSIVTYADPNDTISDPVGITTGADGNLWFTSFLNARIGRIDPDDGSITTFPDTTGNVDRPTGIAAGADGNVWFTDQTTDVIGAVELTSAPPTVPGAPTNVSAVSSASGTATVRFAPPADPGTTPILDYQAQCGTQTGSGPGTGSPPHVNVTGLMNGQTVQCMVRARNSAGYGPFSASVPFTVGVPSGPTNITGGPGTTRGSIVLNWNAASPNGSPVTSYLVRCVPWNQSFPTRATLVGGGARTATLTGLAPGQAHACAVTPANANGSGNPQEAKPVAQIKSKS
jgi:streptogramin lyase